MKKITFLMMAALMGLASYAQQPMQRPSLKSLMQANVTSRSIPLVGTRNASTLASDKFLSMRKAAEDYPIITEQPEGELKTYSREGDKYYVSGQSAYRGTQSGTMSIVYADNNEVYLQNIIVGYNTDAWVKGSLSEDGATITVPLFQNIYYSAQYDAPIVIAMGTVDSGVIMNKVTQEVTYTVADGTITLNGTDETCILTAFWGDDETWTGYGEWNTVLTEYTPDLTLVELPEGLEEVEMPLTGKFYPSVDHYNYGVSYDVEATVKVAKDGNTIYVQGLAQTMPEAWVKGELADGTVTFPVTYIGSDDSGLNYICGYSQNGPVEVTMMYDAELDAYELDAFLFVSPSETELNLSSIKGMYTGLYIGERPALVEVPEGLETVEMPYSGTYTTDDGSNMQEFNATVLVGIDGNDVYMQGLSDIAPNGWVKGSFNEDKTQVIFPFGQYVGISDDGGSVYLLGDDQELSAVGDIKMIYDEDADLYTLQNNLFSNGKKDKFYFYEIVLAGAEVGVPGDVYVAAKQGYANAEDVTEFNIGESATAKLDKADGNNAPKYYDTGKNLRIYAGNTMTISSADKVIAKIEFFFDKGGKQPQHQQLEANVGTYELVDLLGTWTGDEKEIIFTCPNQSGNQARIQKIKIYYMDYTTATVTVPEGLEAQPYLYKGQYEEEQNKVDENGETVVDEEGNPVKETVVNDIQWQMYVAIDGNDVYFQGLLQSLPNAWVKGKMDANGVVTIPEWYLGDYQYYWWSYPVNYGGQSFTYDAEKDQFTTDYFSFTSGGELFEENINAVITRINEVEATPVDPVITEFAGTDTYPRIDFTILQEGTQGELLTGEKLSYVFYIDNEETPLTLAADLYSRLTEDMTEIPTTFSDGYDIYNGRVYLNQPAEEMQAWKKIGLQSIYRGQGVEHRSNIVWYDVEAYWKTVGISEVNTVKADNNVVYDLQGRRVAQPAKGLYIVNGKKVVLK